MSQRVLRWLGWSITGAIILFVTCERMDARERRRAYEASQLPRVSPLLDGGVPTTD